MAGAALGNAGMAATFIFPAKRKRAKSSGGNCSQGAKRPNQTAHPSSPTPQHSAPTPRPIANRHNNIQTAAELLSRATTGIAFTNSKTQQDLITELGTPNSPNAAARPALRNKGVPQATQTVLTDRKHEIKGTSTAHCQDGWCRQK